MEGHASQPEPSSGVLGSHHTLGQPQPENTDVFLPSRTSAPSSPSATNTLSRMSLKGSISPGPSSPSQVSAITVVALLDKLALMLETVQDNQQRMEQRQTDLEGSVRNLQGDVTRLTKSHTTTAVSVTKLLERSRKVNGHVKEVKERLDRQAVQVKKLESNHNHLLKRNNFKVLIYQEDHEIPAGVIVKDPLKTPQPSQYDAESTHPNPSITGSVEAIRTHDEALQTVSLSSDDEDLLAAHREADEVLGLEAAAISPVKFERRADQFKRSSLKKVDTLKRAFTRENIEKKMTKISSKIVPPEKREKIKKSFTPNHPKTASAKTSSFKVSPMTFNVKKLRDTEIPSQEVISPEGEAHVEIPTLGGLDGKIPAVELHTRESATMEIQETLNTSTSESLKSDVSLKDECLKVEGSKVESLKAEGSKAESLKAEGSKAESLKAEGSKAESLKVEVSLNGKTPSVECEMNGDGVAGLAVPEPDEDVGEEEEEGEEGEKKDKSPIEAAAGAQITTETITVEQVS